MRSLEVVVVLGLSVLLGSQVARKLRVAPPTVLLVIGAVLGAFPFLGPVTLPPDIVLFVFLPVLLYWESLTTSLREIRRHLRAIVVLSTLLVVATAAGVAGVAVLLGLDRGAVWVLGAALAPTDATVVAVIAHHLSRTDLTTLRTESLVNDGTALVIFAVAVQVTAEGRSPGLVWVGWSVALAYGGGALAGWLTARLAMVVRRRLDDAVDENLVNILTPFVAFLLAELAGASGVLAVVVCGLILSQVGPRQVRAATRRTGKAFWVLSTHVLNGALFVLLGLQAAAAIRGLGGELVMSALWLVLVTSVTVIGVRLLWLFTTPYLLRAIDRRQAPRALRAGPRQRLVSGLSGFRGAVSMAAALSVPEFTVAGAPFPGRDQIVFVTAGVITLTMVVQTLVLPPLMQWAHLPADRRFATEHAMARLSAAEAALAALPRIATELNSHPDTVEQLRRDLARRVEELRDEQTAGDRPATETGKDRALRLALLQEQRATIIRLRDEQRIDDAVLRDLQGALDIEEIQLKRGGL